ncbi:MAG: hypothetical protein A2542_02255 [Parcubacteria group bacterium RIFOXYD2_FULL_52_8]|nr:MAG: hypothetical protein A2542_02255 [Parcubacteria group bacterium RIFOXYD2_FULL_52_8]
MSALISTAANVVTLTVTSEGKSFETLLRELEVGLKLELSSVQFVMEFLRRCEIPTTNGVTYQLGLLRGSDIETEKRHTPHLLELMNQLRWSRPPAEAALLAITELLRCYGDRFLGNLDLGGLIVMHRPVMSHVMAVIGGWGRSRLAIFEEELSNTKKKWGLAQGFLFSLPSPLPSRRN